MQRVVEVFVIPAGRVPAGPPERGEKRVVDAASVDAALDAARTMLTAEGYRVRSLTMGPRGLLAYVEARP